MRTKGCVWARARAISLQRWFRNPEEGLTASRKLPHAFWASPALCQSFCGLLSPPSARWHLPGFWLICVQEWEGRGHWHTPVSCSLLFPACPGSSPRPSMTGGWSSRESSAAGQFSRNAAANWIHKPSHPVPPQAEWRAHWMEAEGFFSFFFFLCLQSGSCDCFSWYKQLPSQAPGFEVFPRPCEEQRCLNTSLHSQPRVWGWGMEGRAVPLGAWGQGAWGPQTVLARKVSGRLATWLWKMMWKAKTEHSF